MKDSFKTKQDTSKDHLEGKARSQLDALLKGASWTFQNHPRGIGEGGKEREGRPEFGWVLWLLHIEALAGDRGKGMEWLVAELEKKLPIPYLKAELGSCQVQPLQNSVPGPWDSPHYSPSLLSSSHCCCLKKPTIFLSVFLHSIFLQTSAFVKNSSPPLLSVSLPSCGTQKFEYN